MNCALYRSLHRLNLRERSILIVYLSPRNVSASLQASCFTIRRPVASLGGGPYDFARYHNHFPASSPNPESQTCENQVENKHVSALAICQLTRLTPTEYSSTPIFLLASSRCIARSPTPQSNSSRPNDPSDWRN